MMRKKFLFPFLTLAVAAAFSLGACGASQGDGKSEGGNIPSGDVSDSEAEEVKINITSAGGVKEIIVGETLQLSADQEGVTWATRNTDIVSVSNTGLVTGLAAGSARITAEKEGFARGAFTVTVNKAPEKPADYYLGLEQAEHIAGREEGWGAYFYGQWYSGPFDTPVENNNGATEDGTSIGNLYTGCKEILTFTSDKAAKVGLGLTMAYAQQVDLASNLSVKFNNVAVDLTGKVCEGPEDGSTSNYYDFHTVMLGDVDLVVGNNVFEVELIGNSGVNMDNILIYTTEKLELNIVPAVVLEKIVVDPTSVTLEIGGTQQLTTATTGVSYVSSDTAVATVSDAGLITAVAAGSAEITVSKEGMRAAKVAVRVKAAQVVTTYDLVAGSAVRMEFEAGEFYCQNGSWGYPQWGIGPSHDGGETPIEDVESASGGMSLGYFNQTSKVTLKFNSPKAGTISIVLVGAAASAYDLAANVSIKVNETAMDLTGKTIETTGYTDWQPVNLGSIAVNSGLNTFVLEVTGSQGPNLDYIEATLA